MYTYGFFTFIAVISLHINASITASFAVMEGYLNQARKKAYLQNIVQLIYSQVSFMNLNPKSRIKILIQ